MCGQTKASPKVKLPPGVVALTVNGTEQYFKLSSNYGTLDLVAVDQSGNTLTAGFVASIYSDGTLMRHSSITSKIGLKLDVKGKIEEARSTC